MRFPTIFAKQVVERWSRSFSSMPVRFNFAQKHRSCAIFLQSHASVDKLEISQRKINFDTTSLNLSCNIHAVSAADDVSGTGSRDVKANDERRTIDVMWEDGQLSSYPYLFLRDSCFCPQCYDASSRHRIFLLQDLDLNCKPSTLKTSTCGENIHVIWNDGHKSVYPLNWLAEHRFTEENRKKRTDLLRIKPELWGADMANSIPTFDFSQLLGDGAALHNWIYSLQKYGLALIQNAPAECGQLAKIGDEIAFLRPTQYGQVYNVFVKDNPSNAAFTDSALGCHTDMPHVHNTPGMQMLHCVEQHNIDGGENILVDGFYAADQLRQQDKSAYDLCTTLQIDHEDIGQDFLKYHLLARQPTFQLNAEGNLRRVAFCGFTRATKHNMPIEMVEPMYMALKAFDSIMYNPKNHIIHKLQLGEIICMDNQRVMHGRRKFEVKQGGSRHIEGGYIEWDDLMSIYRVLAKEIAET